MELGFPNSAEREESSYSTLTNCNLFDSRFQIMTGSIDLNQLSLEQHTCLQPFQKSQSTRSIIFYGQQSYTLLEVRIDRSTFTR